MSDFLDFNLVYELRNVINETNIFTDDPVEKEKFDLICAVMDRFDTSIMYFNENNIKPRNENDIVLFFYHCCIIRDGIKEVLKILEIEKEDTYIFENYCEKEPFLMSNDEYMGDDKFFEYLRSLFFAHPFLTSRAIPKPIKGEIQYSPYTMNDRGGFFKELVDSLGVMVYSNKREMFHLFIKYDDIKEYIKLKYLTIYEIIESFQKIIDNKTEEWKKRKVNREQSSADILLDIIDILKERYNEDYDVRDLYDYYTCDITNKNNEEIVKKYRKEIENVIPRICDCVDNMDYEEMYNIIRPLLNPFLREIYPMMHYQLEKIYCYLNDDYGDTKWGLKQAKLFANEFAKDWVEIKIDEMSFIEIKLLVTIACYYQSKKEVACE